MRQVNAGESAFGKFQRETVLKRHAEPANRWEPNRFGPETAGVAWPKGERGLAAYLNLKTGFSPPGNSPKLS